ncbi:MAG TPA: hypothetical protein VGV39_15175 [Mesorhizobium sp.]|jgi:hypothetical protein|uniref:hypothetical protein n=1 Tax=Mesorhizobium sp. TaxID=1871066 RepID=UPI002DDDAAF0|nr:hypothetical protein [Mesorhizobium sp.]HEV2504419.1 hypothetical protein [Mesorhizobium sp.]
MGDRAAYQYLELGRHLRARLEADGRGWRVCADEIGVTATDLSRICNGQHVAAHKVIAVCDWLKLSFRAFYVAPDRAAGEAMFHGKSTETGTSDHV